MSSMQAIKTAVESLKDDNLTTESRLQHYSVIKDALDNIYTKGEIIEDNDTIRRVFVCANKDVTSNNSDVQHSVLLTLDLLFKCKCRNHFFDDIPDVYLQFAFEDATESGKAVVETALNCVRACLQGLIIQNKCDPEKLLLKLNSDVTRKKMSELIEKVCAEIPTQRCLIFFYDQLIPRMFDTESVAVRSNLVDEALNLLSRCSITLLSNEKLDMFKVKIKARYVDKVIELRTGKDPNWHNLWIFLIRCCGRMLHLQVDIMNSLLKAVESAFRSVDTEDRLNAYNCWKELIDNYSLDIERMCNSKQMKLIITPLKTNVSKNDHVTYKRFKIWTHLFSVLQERAFVCLEPFLGFCFGPLGETPCIAVEHPNISSPGRKVAKLWQESTRALLEIVGHYGHTGENTCMEYADYSVLKLNRPIVNSGNFLTLDYIITNAIGECSTLMLQWIDKHTIRKVIRCLWGSLFNIIKQLDATSQEIGISRVTAQLHCYIEKSPEKPDYFEYILKPVLDLLLQEQFFQIDVYNRMFLFPLIKDFLNHSDIVFVSGRKIILELVCYGKNTENKNAWFKRSYGIFQKVEAKRNINNLILYWVECADMLIHICRFPTEETKEIVLDTGVEFMEWPISYVQKITQRKINNEFLDKWGSTFQQMHKTFPKESLAFMVKLQSSAKEKPGFASNVTSLFRGFRSMLTSDGDEKFINSLLNLTYELLTLPDLSKEDAGLLLPVAVILMDIIAPKSDEATKNSTFQTLCLCCHHLIQPFEQLKILEPLERFFEKIPSSFIESIPKSLRTVIDDLKKHSDVKISQKADRLLNKLNNPSKETPVKLDQMFLQPKLKQSSRAAKITYMARTSSQAANSPSVEAKTSKEASSIFHMFGKDTASKAHSSIGVRGSQLNNDKSKSQKRKAANVFTDLNKNPVIDQDDDANYVLIDSHYEFNREKLSEHQLETLKKRRSDIPALYQDLSQSQSSSQSLFQSREDKTTKESQNKVENIKDANKKEMSQGDLFCSEDHSYTKTDMNGTKEDPVVNTESKTDVTLPNQNCEDSQKSKAVIIEDFSIIPASSASVSLVQNNLLLSSKLHNVEQASSKSDLSLVNVATHKSDETNSSIGPQHISKDKNEELSDHCTPSTSTYEKGTNFLLGINGTTFVEERKPKQYKNSVHHSFTMKKSNKEKHSVADFKSNSEKNFQQDQTEVATTQTSALPDDEAKETVKLSPVNTIKEKLFALSGEENMEQESLAEKDLKRLSRVQKELNKIKMDIVGGDMFVQNLNLTENKVKTRGRTDPPNSLKGLRLRSSSKVNYDSDDSKSSSGSESNRKSKIRATVAIVDKSKDRRTLSPKSYKSAVPTSSPKSKLTNGDIKTSPMRKLLSDKVDENSTLKDDSTLNSDSVPKKRSRRRSLLQEEDLQDSDYTPEKKEKGHTNIQEKKFSSVKKCLNDILEHSVQIAEKGSDTKVKERKKIKKFKEKRSKTDDYTEKCEENAKENKHKVRTKPERSPSETALESNLVGTNTDSQSSEDVIESSQESFVEIDPYQKYLRVDSSFENKKAPPFNLKNSLDANNVDVFQELNSEIQQIVIRMSQRNQQKESPNSSFDTTLTLSNLDDEPTKSKTEESDSNNTKTELTKNKSEEVKDKQTTENIGLCRPDELMRIDLTPRIISLSGDPRNIYEIDSETEEMVTPRKSINILSSPVSADTPTRTSELLNDTLNISPIKTVPESKDNKCQKTQDLFDSEPCFNEDVTNRKSLTQKSEDIFESMSTNLNEPEVDDHHLEKLSNFILSTDQKKFESTSLNKNTLALSRSAKLLNMVAGTPSPKRIKKITTGNIDKPRINIIAASPKGYRTIKMMQKCEKKLEFEEPSKEEVQIEDSQEDDKALILEKDLLRFTRELPEPTASPKFSILKRRRTPDDEGLSPPRKQKRVNFSDPPMTCKKMFIRDENEHIRYDNKSNDNNDLSHASNNIMVIDKNVELHEEVVISSDIPLSEMDTQSQSIESLGSLDTTDVHLLDGKRPIFPDLVDSKENIHNILGLITNPMFVPALLEELQIKKLHTIGDLAKLTEVEVNRLPLKQPKVTNVHKALSKLYEDKKSKQSSVVITNAQSINGNYEEDMEQVVGIFENEADFTVQPSGDDRVVQTLNDQKLQEKDSLNISGAVNTEIITPVTLQITPLPEHKVQMEKPMILPNRKILRRIPLKAVFPSTVKKTADTSHIVSSNASDITTVSLAASGTMEERKKLQAAISDLMNDFKSLQKKVLQQGLKESSLYETIIEIVGPEIFVSILQNNKSLCITHFIKDNDWSGLFREIVDNIGVRKFIFWLTRIPKMSPLNLVDAIFEQFTGKDAHVEKVALRIMETVSLAVILKQLGVQQIVKELRLMCEDSKFSTEEFFKFAAFTFSPSIEDIIPSFRHINIVQLDDKTLHRSNSTKKDLNNFIERIITVTEKPMLANVFPKDKMLVMYDHKELTRGIISSGSNDGIIESCSMLLQHLPKDELKQDQLKPLVVSLFNKIPYNDLVGYFANYVNEYTKKLPNVGPSEGHIDF